jgi:hypothetical protein
MSLSRILSWAGLGPRHPLAVCAVFRNEAPYLAEWLDFHLAQGVSHFWLYDNASDDAPGAVLAPYVARGVVTVLHWPTPFAQGMQMQAYTHALARARRRAHWVAFIDLDEFLFSPGGQPLPEVLAGFAAHPAVVVHWQIYGSGGAADAGPQPVTARFVHRAPTQWVRNRKVKCIVQPGRTLRPLSPHEFAYRGGALPVNEAGLPVRYRRVSPGAPPPGWHGEVDPFTASDVDVPQVRVDTLRINHYAVRSHAEYLRKQALHAADARYAAADYFAFHDRNDVHDPVLAPPGAG